MSHLLNRSLDLYIGARAVRGVLRPPWSRKRVAAESRHSFGPSILDIDVSMTQTELEDTYREAVDAVVSEINSQASAQDARLRVVLADSRVHYDVVSGKYASVSDRQLQAIADACVNEVLGEQGAGQIVRWQLQPDMQHLLISSMDSQDIDFVSNIALRHQLSLKSLQPDFCRKWNLHASSLPNGTGVFATWCAKHLIVAYVKSGSIVTLSCGATVNSVHAAEDVTHVKCSLDERVDRMLSNAGESAVDVSSFILVTAADESVFASPRWTVIRLSEELA